MKQTGNHWSAPFHGIQHLAGLKSGFQVSVTIWSDSADCDVFTPGCAFNAAETHHANADEARAHGEQQAKLLGALQ